MDIVKLQDMTVKKDHMIMDIHQVTLITMDLTEVMVENQLVNGKAWEILLYSPSSALLFMQCTKHACHLIKKWVIGNTGNSLIIGNPNMTKFFVFQKKS